MREGNNATQPCPCGYYGDKNNRCNCTSVQIQNYTAKLSGPLLDRMDMHIEIGALPYADMRSINNGDSSETIRSRVNKARDIQKKRFQGLSRCITNSGMSSRMVEEYCKVDRNSMELLEKGVERLGLSARAYHRILKIARTIADLDGSRSLEKHHLAEAIQYRRIG